MADILNEKLGIPEVKKHPYVCTPMDEVVSKKHEPLQKLVGDFIYSEELTLFYGLSGLGKSMFAVQMGLAISEGQDLDLGNDIVLENQCEPMKVMYFDLELSERQFYSRVKGLKGYSNFIYCNVKRELPLVIFNQIINDASIGIKQLDNSFVFYQKQPNQVKLRGKISNYRTAKPVPNVRLSIKQANLSTITDSSGNYQFSFGTYLDSFEVYFFHQIMLKLETYSFFDASKVYGIGNSNGSALINKLATETSYFSAVAALASQLIVGSTPNSLTYPVAVYQMCGTADNIIPYNGGMSVVGHNFLSASDSALSWANAFNCTTEPDLEMHGEDEILIYTDCESGKEVRLYSVENAGHNLNQPNTPNFYIPIWEFLKRF